MHIELIRARDVKVGDLMETQGWTWESVGVIHREIGRLYFGIGRESWSKTALADDYVAVGREDV